MTWNRFFYTTSTDGRGGRFKKALKIFAADVTESYINSFSSLERDSIFGSGISSNFSSRNFLTFSRDSRAVCPFCWYNSIRGDNLFSSRCCSFFNSSFAHVVHAKSDFKKELGKLGNFRSEPIGSAL